MRLSHHDYYLQMLELVAARCTCVRRNVGAIIVDKRYRVLSTGYNGVPSGFTHCIDKPCPGALDPSGDSQRCMGVHAEVNAMLQCSRINDARTMYVSCVPCFSCAKMICNTPIETIVTVKRYADDGGTLVLHEGKIKIIITEDR